MRVPIPDLTRFSLEVLERAGLNSTDAKTTADVLVTTDSWGVFTHGTKSLRGYLRRLRAGGLNAHAKPQVYKEGLAWAAVDGQSAVGMVTSEFAMRQAIAKATKSGIGFAGVRNSCHFGAAGYYAFLAAEQGMIGIAMANDAPSVAAPNSRGAVMGSNPLGFAIPHEARRPLLMDIATSTVAGGKVYAASTLGKPIPEGWLLDTEGRPTIDPSQLLRGGALTPMAGHKGYGIALLIESLAGVLTGALLRDQILSWMMHDPKLPTGHGAAFIAIDVGALMPLDSFRERMRIMIENIRSAPARDPAIPVSLPGDLEWRHREEAEKEGIPLPDDVMHNLKGVADDLNIPFPWTVAESSGDGA